MFIKRYIFEQSWTNGSKVVLSHGGQVKGLATYFAERFPLPVTLALSLGTSMLFIGSLTNPDESDYLLKTGLVSIAFFNFMLRSRITDEFKDFKHDGSNYPNRPLQRGVVSKKILIAIGFTALAIELASIFAVFSLSRIPEQSYLYLPMLGFSALLAVEFFAPNWLERHFNIYFLSHQSIFFTFWIWLPSLFEVHIDATAQGVLFGSILFMVAVEVARKYEIRLDPDGSPVKDTYLTVWGKAGSIFVSSLSMLAGSWLFFYRYPHSLYLLTPVALLSSLLFLHKNPKAVQAVIILTFLAESVLVYIS